MVESKKEHWSVEHYGAVSR